MDWLQLVDLVALARLLWTEPTMVGRFRPNQPPGRYQISIALLLGDRSDRRLLTVEQYIQNSLLLICFSSRKSCADTLQLSTGQYRPTTATHYCHALLVVGQRAEDGMLEGC